MLKPHIRVSSLLAAIALAACSPGAAPVPIQGTELTGAEIGGPFTLVDKDGKTVNSGDFAGRYLIVYFGYTFCPDACPTDVGVLMRGFAQFEKAHPELAAKVQPIFISIDPARDTPAKVGEFAAAFSPRLIGLTGSQAQVDAAVKAYKAVAQRGNDTPGGYLMDHSRMAYLMGPKGEPIEALPVDKNAEAVAADLAASVK
ncbi:SCO family protein [Novosphingobium sp.]|uniref:SCO family protein n=1 Tax=Novosphingobium sp. TaxID=1874826 RepID=UPI0035B270D3